MIISNDKLNPVLSLHNRQLPFLIFSFFLLAYLASSGGHGDPYDGISFFLITENLFLEGVPTINVNSPSADDLGFDVKEYIRIKASLEAWPQWKKHAPDIPFGEYRDEYLKKVNWESYFSNAYLVLPIAAVPLYGLAVMLNISLPHFVFLFLNSIIIATTCVIVFLLGNKIYKSEKIGFVLSLIFGITSFMWPYITTMFANPLSILFLILSIYLIIHQREKSGIVFPFIAGLSTGLSFLSHLGALFLMPSMLVFGLFEFRKNWKQMAVFAVGILICLVIQGYLNYLRTDFPLDFGYYELDQPKLIEEGDYTKLFSGIYGLLFSTGNSIFLYFPIALLYPIGLYYLYKQDKSLTLLFIVLSVTLYLFIATDSGWIKSPYWGPHRFLLPIVPFITISIGSLISKFYKSIRWKWGIISLSISGFFVNLLGNLVWIQYAYAYGWGPEELWKIEDKNAVFVWNPYYSPVVQTIKVLSSGWTTTIIEPASGYFKVGLQGCSFDLYLFCQFGIIPILLLAGGIIFVSYLIMKYLTTKIKEV